MKSFYYKTFARLCLIPYIGGTIIHILRLMFDLSIEEIPLEADSVIVIIGGYGGLGLIIFANKIPFKNIWDKIAYGLLIFHLNISVIVHAYILFVGNHDILSVFPYGYSFIAVGYFLAFVLYIFNLNKRLYRIDNHQVKPTTTP